MTTSEPRPRWLWLNAIALAFSLIHVLIDFSIGLWGKSSTVLSAAQMLNITAIALTYGWWVWALGGAARGEWRGLAGVFALTLLWSFLANGVLGLLVAPPPSAAFPYQDAAHLGNIVFGGLALWALWPSLRAELPGRAAGDWRAALSPLALLVVIYAVESILFLAK